MKPNTDIGQHFLVDTDVLRDILDAADLHSSDTVLEIGPGKGVLTAALAEHAGHVIAIELDQRLLPVLERRFAKQKNIEIIHADAVRWWGERLRSPVLRSLGGFKVVANLPYNITSRVLRMFLEHPPRPERMVVMVQKEVAERVCAAPGALSLLSLAVQYFARPDILRVVPPECFDPPPAVESAILRIIPHGDVSEADDTTMRRVFQLARMGFSSRRKQLHGLIAKPLRREREEIKNVLVALGIAPQARAQELSVDQWKALAVRFPHA